MKEVSENKILQVLREEKEMKLLGHEEIDTTLHYAMVKQSTVKLAHKKYMG